ncbi:FtsK/SpoIIIE family DNA translocase [Falsirhodobacter sp. 20TX0035]|uniref:FtsK/SpoIIIE family DNA translocase n=1 Tax=Falsirhodobacter sp. 20TX0035 TaxID=3022019 RepID=UPI00232D4F6E|nr:DNA translocase FtsK 4TM domain-containing protein [Falsirhodobacter sp. 20TX0035]MDB6452547.1 DNA translocase FtsK 4TM domain-containing protein [Falsirhodobacter sp. 20TX0035]
MASYHVRQRDPLLDESTQEMLQKRGRELLGVGLVVLGLIFVMMLGSYSPQDKGWMVESDQPIQNMLGGFGAAIASTLIVVVGKGAWAIPAILFLWGGRFVLHQGSERAVGRVVFAVVAVAVASTFAATHAPGADWQETFGLGGLFGDTVLAALLNLLPLPTVAGLKLLSLAGGVGLLASLLFVTGFTMAEVRRIWHFLLLGLILTYTTLLGLAGRSATGAAQMAATVQDRRREKAARMQDWDDEVVEDDAPRSRSALLGGAVRGLAARLSARPPVDEIDLPEPSATRMGDLTRAAAQRHEAAWGRPDALSAAPRGLAAEPREVVVAPPPQPRGLLARGAQMMRRVVDPDPQPEPVDVPTEDRIKARINDAIRVRAHQSAPPVSPVTAAVQRREPPLAGRRKSPQPLVAEPRRARAVVDLPPEPPVRAVRAIPRLGPATDEPANTAAQRLDEEQWAEDGPEMDDAFWANQVETTTYAEEEEDWPEEQLDAAFEQDEAPSPAPAAMTPTPRAARAPIRYDDPVPYELPPLTLLSNPDTIQRNPLSVEALEDNARQLESVLDDYGVKGEIVSVRPGPVVTMYELEPAPGLKASRVIGLADDIARSMSALSARVSTVPGRTVIGIELPNANREKVVLREILASQDFSDGTHRLPLALGKDIGGGPVVANLAKMPHLLIAGTTGSGKSVAINTMILSLLYKLTPEECRLIMIDPKMLELSVYDGIPHLLSPVVTDPKKAVVALKWVVGEMEERYRKMSKMGVRNIEGYNGRVREALDKGELFKRTIQTGFDEDTGEPVFETEEFLPVVIPFIVVVVDEMADLMMVAGKEIEACIQRLAQMARASGIHLIMATQRPSVDVITGTIKANFPTRISFSVTSKIDSRTILGEQGAEQLLGMGDMLYMAGGSKISRIHGPFVSDEEVEEIVNHLKSFGPPTYMSGVVEGPEDDRADDIDAVLGLGGNTDGEDSLYDQAVAVVAKDRKCSTSYIQRKLGVGYNKAAKLVEQMEEQGVVTAANHVGKREILLPEQ